MSRAHEYLLPQGLQVDVPGLHEGLVVEELQPQFAEAMERLQPEVQKFAQALLPGLLCVGRELVDKEVIRDEQAYQRGVLLWLKEDQHGVGHSYDVLVMSLRIRNEDNLQVTDEELAVRAALHDMGQYFHLEDR